MGRLQVTEVATAVAGLQGNRGSRVDLRLHSGGVGAVEDVDQQVGGLAGRQFPGASDDFTGGVDP